jgi:CheY-like chemotaxis protein
MPGAAARCAPGARLRILLAEDNSVNQMLAMRSPAKHGHTVIVAGNGYQALAALDRQRFDLVLMDVQMPEMDGFETAAADQGGPPRVATFSADLETGH